MLRQVTTNGYKKYKSSYRYIYIPHSAHSELTAFNDENVAGCPPCLAEQHLAPVLLLRTFAPGKAAVSRYLRWPTY